MGTNPVGTFLQTIWTSLSPTAYKNAIDANFAVAKRSIDNFAPHQQATPNMTILLDAGVVYNGATLTEVAQQTSATIATPITYPRIDRVVIDKATGIMSILTGVESGTPVAPSLTSGVYPIAQILLQITSAYIANSMITDERATLVGVAQHISAATNKTTPVGADLLGIVDSVTNALNKLSLTNLISYLQGIFIPANYYSPVAWNGSTDRVLGVGQHTSDSFTSATSMPLHIACGDGQIYEMEMHGSFSPAAAGSIAILQPNNTVPAVTNFTLRGLSLSGITPTYYNSTYADAGFRLESIGGSVYNMTGTFFVLTQYGSAIITSGGQTSAASSFQSIESEWGNNSVAWSSFGTITMPNAWTGQIVVRRVA